MRYENLEINISRPVTKCWPAGPEGCKCMTCGQVQSIYDATFHPGPRVMITLKFHTMDPVPSPLKLLIFEDFQRFPDIEASMVENTEMEDMCAVVALFHYEVASR